MARNLRNRSITNDYNQNEDETNTNSIDSILDEFLSRNANAFFFISVDPRIPNRIFLKNHIIPIFIVRDIVYGETTDNSHVSGSLSGFLMDLINNIRKKEKIRKQLNDNETYRFTKNHPHRECPVCLDDFKPKQHIRKLACEHEFHQKCIDRWLIKGNICCPICRNEPFPNKT